MRVATALAVLAAMVDPALAQTITGNATVVRPYAFSLAGYQVYLLGVDSVEHGQTCAIGARSWDCWAAAFRQLETIVGEGTLSCDLVVGPDAQGRVIAVCAVNGEDVGLRFVESGFGLALPMETTRYDAAQAEARAAARGLWQGGFVAPVIWRSRPFAMQSGRPRFMIPAG